MRVRYAPSPTGELHLGGLRTALFNSLFARSRGGSFVLRIEDTDRSREVPQAAERLLEALRWCGLHPDEGPHTQDGLYAPYVQSQRLQMYQEAAQRLVEAGAAYPCFCSAERLVAVREEAAAAGNAPRYDRACAGIPSSEAAARVEAGESHTVRLRVPPSGTVTLVDAVVGAVNFDVSSVDDQVLLKSDGWPTYHLASVVDDHKMDITHVIRGLEWLSSTPKHLLLYAAFGWTPPEFVHLPLLVNTDRAKLSKRHGDVSVQAFRDAGYTPEGLINFVALLGWNPKTETEAGAKSGSDVEVFSLEELEALFDLSGLNKANAAVDRARLDHFNAFHMRRIAASDPDRLAQMAAPFVQPAIGVDLTADESAMRLFTTAVTLQVDRARTLRDFADLVGFFFQNPDVETVAEKLANFAADQGVDSSDIADILRTVAGAWAEADEEFDKAAAAAPLKATAKTLGVKMKRVMLPVRLSLTGAEAGAGLGDIAAAIGQDAAVRRLQAAADAL